MIRAPAARLSLCAALVALTLAPVPAVAQQRTLFDFLFGRPAPPPQPHYVPRPSAPRQAPVVVERPSEPTRPPRGGVEQAKPQALLRLAVIGDGYGEWLSYGLTQAFAETPEVAILDRSKAFASILRTDHSEFVKLVGEATGKDATIDGYVVMLGLADRLQSIKRDKDTIEPRTDAWSAAFAERIEAIALGLKARGVPVVWVGLPPLRGPKANGDFSAMNQLIRTQVEKQGLGFVDIWDGFLTEKGEYAATGPDVSGQNRRLRHGDGVHFTPAGGRKLGFFVEQDLRRRFAARLGGQAPLADIPPPPIQPELGIPVPNEPAPDLAAVGLAAKPPKPAIGAHVTLTGSGGLPVQQGSAGALEGAAAKARAPAPAALPTPASAGHAMDFRWPQGAGKP